MSIFLSKKQVSLAGAAAEYGRPVDTEKGAGTPVPAPPERFPSAVAVASLRKPPLISVSSWRVATRQETSM
jgi:hypothetical protein